MHLERFIRMHYGCSDLPLQRLDREFLSAFHNYIANQTSHKTNTVWIYLIALKHVLPLALIRGTIDRNLFTDYKLHSAFCRRDCLSMDELMRMAAFDPQNSGLALVGDTYLFSCFTRLSYVDIKSLTMRNIKKATNFGFTRHAERRVLSYRFIPPATPSPRRLRFHRGC